MRSLPPDLQKPSIIIWTQTRPLSRTKIKTCDLCPFSTYTNFQLKKHKAHKHSNEKPFLCSLCDKRFVMEGDLRRHHKSAHSIEGKIQCPLCSYTTTVHSCTGILLTILLCTTYSSIWQGIDFLPVYGGSGLLEKTWKQTLESIELFPYTLSEEIIVLSTLMSIITKMSIENLIIRW